MWMTDRQLRDEATTLYLAGHETTALAVTWIWCLLSQHPHVEEKLAAEWQRVLAGSPPTVEQLTSLPYTAAVIAESMRLFASVYVIGREAMTDLDLCGYGVKRGYTVLMSQWVNHRDPKIFPFAGRVPSRTLGRRAAGKAHSQIYVFFLRRWSAHLRGGGFRADGDSGSFLPLWGSSDTGSR
jgi:cytochrome P450